MKCPFSSRPIDRSCSTSKIRIPMPYSLSEKWKIQCQWKKRHRQRSRRWMDGKRTLCVTKQRSNYRMTYFNCSFNFVSSLDLYTQGMRKIIIKYSDCSFPTIHQQGEYPNSQVLLLLFSFCLSVGLRI